MRFLLWHVTCSSPRPMHFLTRLTPLALLAACSSTTVTAPAGDPAPAAVDPPASDPPSSTDPVPDPQPQPPATPTFPKVLSRGGPVIAKPRVVPVVFAGDELAPQIDAFGKKLAGSQYWSGVGTEYGIGAMTAGDMITIDEAAPTTITSTEIESWLVGKLSGTTPAFGAPDANTLYAIYYPATTSISMEGAGEMGQSCQGYGGYHFEVAVGATTVGYAVLPRCAGLDDLTVAASHEYFEWATDPFPQSNPAYNRIDDELWAWQAVMIGELSDLCTFLDQDYLHPAELGFTVQRQWSNALSLSGAHPCAPKKDAAYTQLVAFPEDEATVPDYGSGGGGGVGTKYITTKAIRVDPSGSRTVDLTLYSDRKDTADVKIHALSYADFYRTGQKTGFTFSLDKTKASVGEKVQLTVNAPADGFDIVVLATLDGGRYGGFWPVLVSAESAAGSKSGKPTVTPQTLPKAPSEIRTRNARVRVTKLGIPTLSH